MSQPRVLDHPLYRLLRNDDISGFNAQKPEGGSVDLSGGDFRGLDLRKIDPRGVNFTAAWTCDKFHWKAPVWPTRRFPACTSRSS